MSKETNCTKDEFYTHTLKYQTCKKCSALFLCKGDKKIWIPKPEPKFDDQDNMINQNTKLSQRVCRPYGGYDCINPDRFVEGGQPWEYPPISKDFQLESSKYTQDI